MKATGSNLQDGDSFLKEPLKKGLLVHIAMQGPTAGAQQSVYLAEIEALLQEFSGVFDKLVGLPPLSGHEHHINFKNGAQPICQRPYRYPYYQKIEI